MKKITDYAELVKAKHALNKTIAPVEDGASMAGSYTSGQQFIRDGVLYTALTSIAASTAWSSLTLDTDYEVADDLTTQLASVNQTLTNNVRDINTALGNEVATRAKVSGHNLLPYPYTNGTKTEEGITWTPQADGSVLVNGTATADSYFRFVYDATIPNVKVGTAYTFSISGSNSAELIVAYLDSSNVEHTLGVVTSEATYTIPNDYVKARLVAKVYSGTTISNATIYPMFRLATDANSDYEPYSMTNQELTPIAQAVSNRNLLDNPWFTVNQRGASSYSTNGGYTVDRWRNWSTEGEVITVNSDNSLTLTKSATDKTLNITQVIEESVGELLVGKTVTLSVMLGDGTVKSVSGIVEKSNSFAIRVSIDDTTKASLDFYRYSDVWNARIISWAGGTSAPGSITIKAIKLELGSVSTLAQDTAPNYQQELAKCQRYFQRIKRGSTYTNSIGFGFASSETQARIFIPLPVEMRATPTATISSLSHYRVVGNGGVQTPSAISVTNKETNGVNVICTGASLTTNQIYNLNDSGDETSYIDLSADL